MMQESRLFRIVYYLLDKGKATAPELSEKFEVSLRTIYRDIDAISSAGIPIYAQTGRNGGIYLYDDFVLDKVVLSKAEKQEILTALQSLAITGHGEKETLIKLSALFHLHSENWFEIDFSRWGEVSNDNQKFDNLRSAILQHKCIEMTYVSSYSEKKKRIVQPLKLVYKSKSWYLKAFCEDTQSFRIFKLNRIIEWTVIKETFTPLSIPVPFDTPQTYREIILSFTKDISYRVYDEFDTGQIEVQEDESLLVKAHMPEDEWLVHFLMSFGTQVTIIEPLYLRDEVMKQAIDIYNKYKP